MRTECTLPEIHVQPGESRLTREPGILSTLLGSCVGITFWVERKHIGALCHPMLPDLPLQRAASVARSTGQRYVNFAVRDMAAQLDALGVRRAETEVKVFGGADVLDFHHRGSRPTVGMMNREAAFEILRTEGYSVAASSLGGKRGIHIRFNTSNGEVLLRRIGAAGGGSRGPHSHPQKQEA